VPISVHIQRIKKQEETNTLLHFTKHGWIHEKREDFEERKKVASGLNRAFFGPTTHTRWCVIGGKKSGLVPLLTILLYHW
jgi:hypothetical protein